MLKNLVSNKIRWTLDSGIRHRENATRTHVLKWNYSFIKTGEQ